MKQQVQKFIAKSAEFLRERKEYIIVLMLLLISGAAHSYNMFSFPYYENDEGVYMSQAWSVVTQGQMAPYTYWYDHSPAGWLMIALWAKLTGGFFTFGVSTNTGRVFMLVLHIFSTYFLYHLAKKFSGGDMRAGLLAALVFALSPIGIYFQRRVLLDNMMVFWLLLSLYILFILPKRLINVVLSAAAFALACLSKESGVFFVPVYLLAVYYAADRRHLNQSLLLASVIFVTICSLYPLYALLKGELFPMGSMFDSGGEHVSLLGTLLWQATREGGSAANLMRQWTSGDAVTMIAGFFFTLSNLLAGVAKRNRYLFLSGFLSLSYIFYILRGGIVIEFYIIGLIPLLALNIGIALSALTKILPRLYMQRSAAAAMFIVMSFLFLKEGENVRGSLTGESDIYRSDQTASQLAALEWVKKNIPSDKTFVIDNYAYIDLQDSYSSAIPFKNSQWYWKVALDPAIRDSLLKNDWQNIDYVLETPQMQNDVNFMASDTMLQKTFSHSKPFKRFWSDGWGVEIWKTYNPDQMLEDSWTSYKMNFTEDGRSFDPYSGGKTTSEGQSYSLLRSIWMDDKENFDKTLDWTNAYMKLSDSNLFIWSWTKEDDKPENMRFGGSATDADEDIALALLFAYKKTKDPRYLEQAKGIIADIWRYEVIEVRGRPYLTAGNWNSGKSEIVINPSYFAPYAYRIFAEMDPSHNWNAVIDTSYEILDKGGQENLDKQSTLGLPPNWLALDAEGNLQSASKFGDFSSDYSYDAIRIPWRIALDYEWNGEPRAKRYLDTLSFLDEEWRKNGRIKASYSHDGAYSEDYEATESYGGNMGYFKLIDPQSGREIYEQKLLGKYFEDDGSCYWDDPKNYYKQNWAWFGTALYSDQLPNIWKE